MDGGQATVRNMRSKCQCSCVLQFTFRRAVGCVLHRPPSQVIHCIVLYFLTISRMQVSLVGRKNNAQSFNIPSREGSVNFQLERRAKALSAVRISSICRRSTAPVVRAATAGQSALTALRLPRRPAERGQALGARSSGEGVPERRVLSH